MEGIQNDIGRMQWLDPRCPRCKRPLKKVLGAGGEEASHFRAAWTSIDTGSVIRAFLYKSILFVRLGQAEIHTGILLNFLKLFGGSWKTSSIWVN